MNDSKHKAAEQSYTLTRADQHELDFVPQDERKHLCQMCSTGRGMRVPNEYHQTKAEFKCATCNTMVCGVGCWKLLHGYYKQGEEPEEKPRTFQKGEFKGPKRTEC